MGQMIEFFNEFLGLLTGAIAFGAFIDKKIHAIDRDLGCGRVTLPSALRAVEEEVFHKFLLSEKKLSIYLIKSFQISIIFTVFVILCQSIYVSDSREDIKNVIIKFFDFPVLFFTILIGNCVVDSISYYQTSILVSFMTMRHRVTGSAFSKVSFGIYRVKCLILSFCDIVASIKIFTLLMPLVLVVAIKATFFGQNSNAKDVEISVTSNETIDYTGRSATASMGLRLLDGSYHTFSVIFAALPDGVGREFARNVLLGDANAELVRTENISDVVTKDIFKAYPNLGKDFVPAENITDYFMVEQLPIESGVFNIYEQSFFQYDGLENSIFRIFAKGIIFNEARKFLGYSGGRDSVGDISYCIATEVDGDCIKVISLISDVPSPWLIKMQYAVDFLSNDLPFSALFISSTLASVIFYLSVLGLWFRRRVLMRIPIFGTFIKWPVTSALIGLTFIAVLA